MMHYKKAENVEKELSKSDLPFEDCMKFLPPDFLWMHVKGGTKVSNVIDFATAALNKGEYRCVIWSGSGGGVVKTVSCAEVLKRSHTLFQVTRMGHTSVEEHWKPQMDGLDEIIVKRQLPTLHILMSLDELPDSITDLQKPNRTDESSEFDEVTHAQLEKQPGNSNAASQQKRFKGNKQRPRQIKPK